MKKSHSFAIALLALFVSVNGGAQTERYSAMPVLTTPEVSTQVLAKSAQQWAKHADAVASQMGKIPEFVGRPVYVPTQAVGAIFLETYASLLSSSLTKNGISVSVDPKSPLTVEVVTHLLRRAGGTHVYAGNEPLDKVRRLPVRQGPEAVEMVVVTTVRERLVSVYSNREIFYIDPAEYRQFVGDVQPGSLKSRKADEK
jgi:hypothetical protein